MGNCIKSNTISNGQLPNKNHQWTVIPVQSQPQSADPIKVHPEGHNNELLQGQQPLNVRQEPLQEEKIEILNSPFQDIDPLKGEEECSIDASKLVNNHQSKNSSSSEKNQDSVNCESVNMQGQNIHISHTSSAIVGKEEEQPQKVEICSESNQVIPRIDPTKSHLINPSADPLELELKQGEELAESEMIASYVLNKKQSAMKSTDETLRVQQIQRNNIDQSVIMIQTHKKQ